MATYLEYLSFMNGLKWYKKLFFPKFLTEEELKQYRRIVDSEKTELDIARDHYFFAWNEHKRKPTPHMEELTDYWRYEVDKLLKEQYQREIREREKCETDNLG